MFIQTETKFFVPFCIILSLLLFVFFDFPAISKDGSLVRKEAFFTPDRNDLERLTKLLITVNRFKEVSLTDYQKAFLMVATDEVIKKVNDFNEKIWIETSPQIGWSFFLSTSVHTVGGARGKYPLVAFYNPWSDVFLTTVWKIDDEIPRIVDAEILMGDWLRKEDPTISPVPHWLRTDMFKPAALGISVAEAIMAFERLFPSEPVTNWRKKLPILQDQQLLVDLNYPTVAIRLFNILKNIDNLRSAAGKKDNPSLESCGSSTIATVNLAAQGRIGDLLKIADETLPEMKTILKSLKSEWFRTLEVVAVVTGRDGCLVFLAPVFDATGSISFFFKDGIQKLVLKRIDVIDYQGFYAGQKREKESVQKGGKK